MMRNNAGRRRIAGRDRCRPGSAEVGLRAIREVGLPYWITQRGPVRIPARTLGARQCA